MAIFFLYERNKYTMKKYIKFLIIICIVGVCICGCNKQEETTPLTIYEQLKITDRPLSEADSGVIQEGITNWVKNSGGMRWTRV